RCAKAPSPAASPRPRDPVPPTMHHRPMHWPLIIVLAVVLALTAWLYARPEIAILLAEQLWACFGAL
ncbi:MAG: hypothetical protein ACOVQL_00220, partial [Limnohabitans sp.]